MKLTKYIMACILAFSLAGFEFSDTSFTSLIHCR